MKRFFLVEADTEFYAMFAYEVHPIGTSREVFFRDPDADTVACSSRPEQFFGQLNALCITRKSNPQELPLETPAPVAATPTTEQEPI